MGLNGIIAMLSAKTQHDAATEIATIANQWGWIALKIATERAAMSESPADVDVTEQLKNAGANGNLIHGYEGGQTLLDWTSEANVLDPDRRNRVIVARYLLGRGDHVDAG